MRSLHLIRQFSVCVLLFSPAVNAADWLALPSQYTHDPATGLRVSQYAPTPTPSAPLAADFRSSGYTHVRSSINYGQSADNYHRVQQWGPPVQPYGEWRFPNRPYSVPYSQWGAPYAGLGTTVLGGGGSGWRGYPGGGYPGGGYPGGGYPGGGYPGGGYPGAGGYPGGGYPGAGGVFGQPGQGPYGPGLPGNSPAENPNAQYLDGYHPVYRD